MITIDSYRRRIIDDELDEVLPQLPAVVIEGARGIGKTATAQRRATTVFRLDDPDQRAIIAADLHRVARAERPVLIDEWQRVPGVWDVVRREVDDGARPGSFLLTGSTPPVELPTHSGAARLVSIRMRPMSLVERDVETPTVSLATLLAGGRLPIDGSTSVDLDRYTAEIVRSGFPGLRHLSGRAFRLQMESYQRRLAEHDLVELGQRLRKPDLVRRWLAAYAAATATTTSYEAIRDAATSGDGVTPARTSTQPLRDLLEQLWVVDAMAGWAPTRNHLARLTAPPKHHLVDTALGVHLLGLSAPALLSGSPTQPTVMRDGPFLGSLFESMITQSVRTYAQQAEAVVHHLRTGNGNHEIDLIVGRSDGKVVALEVKLNAAPDDSDVRHLHWLRQQIGDDLLDAVVITTGRQAYRRPDGIAVIPAALLGP